MALSEQKVREYTRRLLLSRMRILCEHGFYGLLLMHMKFAVDEACETAATDGERIIFGPEFLENLSDREIDFVMMHEILHVALRHCKRTQKRDNGNFNIACDIVVNSNILKSCDMDLTEITLSDYGVSMHLTPDGKEGYLYTAEQVYDMLPVEGKSRGSGKDSANDKSRSDSAKRGNGAGIGNGKDDRNGESGWDDHSGWKEEDTAESRALWQKRIMDAANAIEIRESCTGRGTVPLGVARLVKKLKEPQTDWRTLLQNFVQQEICDYSFSPPDRRFWDNPFFLPDFNETEDTVSDILFMIDTSGSMSDRDIAAVYSEVKGAVDQFGGAICGWLGFFDGAVVEPQRFTDEEEFKVIQPAGGGGTDFQIIFDYVSGHMREQPPVGIIILTDGYAPFPKENAANGIPVLWMLTNENAQPPWGKVARIRVS